MTIDSPDASPDQDDTDAEQPVADSPLEGDVVQPSPSGVRGSVAAALRGITPDRAAELATAVSDRALNVGVDGFGPWKSSIDVADEALAHHGDPEVAIRKLIAATVRLTATSGFVTGLGGLITLPVALPADLTALWLAQARLAGAIAHLRGYDVRSEEVRSIVMISLVGSTATEALAKAGVEVGTKSAISAIKHVPGKVLIEINKKVGFRLVTKAGTKGVVNLTKLAPVAGGVIGGSVNLVSTRVAGKYAKINFPALDGRA